MIKLCTTYILLVFMVFTISGCDIIYRMLHKEGAEEKELVGDIIPFEKNHTIEEIQQLLKVYGYNPGKIDGVLGMHTRNAIVNFQKNNNLEETRFVDQKTWEKLSIFKKENLVINGEVNVKLVQKVLTIAGFSSGKADGVMGAKTQEAIKVFQREHQLKADGKIGYKTLSALSFYLQ
jgi:peptidoglycan hydrolase-like protein with peptidoglycan-binding domain